MNFCSRFFLFLFLYLCICHCYIYASLNFNNTKKCGDLTQDQKYIELFLHVFFLDGDFSYTLFGEKPMSFSGVSKNEQNLIEKIDHLLPTSKELSLEKAVETFKKYRKHLDKCYQCIFNENSINTFIYFIHRDAFLKAIDNNLDVFLKELGEDFTAASFLNEILEEKKPLLEIIHYHEGILGILLGYGRHNSLLFQKKADILGRCWGYDQEIKQNGAMYLCSANNDSKELECLYNTLEPFSVETEYSPLIFVAPLSFGADKAHPETKQLKEKYTSLRTKINEVYAKADPFGVMLRMLGLVNNCQ